MGSQRVGHERATYTFISFYQNKPIETDFSDVSVSLVLHVVFNDVNFFQNLWSGMCVCEECVCACVCLCVCARAQNQPSDTPGVNRLSSSKYPVYPEAVCRDGPSEFSCRKGLGSATPESNIHSVTRE